MVDLTLPTYQTLPTDQKIFHASSDEIGRIVVYERKARSAGLTLPTPGAGEPYGWEQWRSINRFADPPAPPPKPASKPADPAFTNALRARPLRIGLRYMGD